MDREILWKKLKKMGFRGKFLASLQKLYEVMVDVAVDDDAHTFGNLATTQS